MTQTVPNTNKLFHRSFLLMRTALLTGYTSKPTSQASQLLTERTVLTLQMWKSHSPTLNSNMMVVWATEKRKRSTIREEKKERSKRESKRDEESGPNWFQYVSVCASKLPLLYTCQYACMCMCVCVISRTAVFSSHTHVHSLCDCRHLRSSLRVPFILLISSRSLISIFSSINTLFCS